MPLHNVDADDVNPGKPNTSTHDADNEQIGNYRSMSASYGHHVTYRKVCHKLEVMLHNKQHEKAIRNYLIPV